MDKVTVVCHKDHDKGYEEYVGKCLLCEVERLRKREWSGLSVSKAEDLLGEFENNPLEMLFALDKYLREKNTSAQPDPDEKRYTPQDMIDVVDAVAGACKREWVGLTDEEHMLIYTKADSGLHKWAKAIEAKLKEKNT